MVSSILGSQLIIITIAITHLLASCILITPVIALELLPSSDSFIIVSWKAPGAGVLIIAAAAAATLGPTTVDLIIVATAVFRIARTHPGTDARCGSVCNCVHCILCRVRLRVSALHPHGSYGSLRLIV